MAYLNVEGQLADTAGAIYTVPAATTAKIKSMELHNTHGSSVDITIHSVPNNGGAVGTASVATQKYAVNLAPNSTVELPTSFPRVYIAQNDSIQGSASVNNVVNFAILGVTE